MLRRGVSLAIRELFTHIRQHIYRLALFSADCTEAKKQLSKACTTSSSSQASIYRLELLVWVTPQTERVIVLSKILALSKSIALLLAVISRQGQGSAVTTILSKPRMLFNVCEDVGLHN